MSWINKTCLKFKNGMNRMSHSYERALLFCVNSLVLVVVHAERHEWQSLRETGLKHYLETVTVRTEF